MKDLIIASIKKWKDSDDIGIMTNIEVEGVYICKYLRNEYVSNPTNRAHCMVHG
jgi:hypothetical protein